MTELGASFVLSPMKAEKTQLILRLSLPFKTRITLPQESAVKSRVKPTTGIKEIGTGFVTQL